MVAVRMTGSIHLSSGTKNLTIGKIRTGAGVKTLVAGFKRTSTGLKQLYAAIQIALSSYSVIGRGNSASIVNVTSAAVTATVTGAIGTVNHVWTRTAPDAHAWTIDSPNSPTTTFSTIADQGESWDATFIDTVTDQGGQVLASSAVSVDCANIYYGGGYEGPGGGGHAYP